MNSTSRRLRNTLLVFGFLLGACSAVGESATTRPEVRLLVITGGHGYDREAFLEVFRTMPGIRFTHVEHTKGTADGWDRADPAEFDAVFLYDMPRTITGPQKDRFREFLARGRGLVVTHHALVSYQGWPEYERIIGGRYVDVPAKGGDPTAAPSGYEHDVDIPVVIGARAHPVTAGLRDFVIHDEIYWDFRVGADVTPLLTTIHPKSGNPLAWCRTEGKARVVYVLFGHGPTAFQNPDYRRLVANAIQWVAP